MMFASWLINIPATRNTYLRDGSAQTVVLAAILREKLQIKVDTSPCHSILTPGQPVLRTPWQGLAGPLEHKFSSDWNDKT